MYKMLNEHILQSVYVCVKENELCKRSCLIAWEPCYTISDERIFKFLVLIYFFSCFVNFVLP